MVEPGEYEHNTHDLVVAKIASGVSEMTRIEHPASYTSQLS